MCASKRILPAVARIVEEDAEMSIRRRSQLVGLCSSTTSKIFLKDLGLRAYKIKLMQELKPNDHRLHRIFADWANLKLTEDEHFYRKILFSDEAHFWLNGFVNKQNCGICSEDNHHHIH